MNSKIHFVFIAMCFCFIKAEKEEETKLIYLQYVLDCATEFNVSPAEISDLAKRQVADSDNVKCLLACTFKKIGVTDDEGKLSAEGIKKIADRTYADKPELKEKSEMFTKACLFVNDEDINGDKKECERAVKIYKCFIENASTFSV